MIKIAVPLAGRRLCMHFGHCEEFAVVEVEETTGTVSKVEYLTPPPHEPGVIPNWIAGLGVKAVIAGGMGAMARQMLAARGVEVLAGAADPSPEKLAEAYCKGALALGDNVCDHDHAGHGHGHEHGHNCGNH